MMSWHKTHQPAIILWCKVCKAFTPHRLNNFQMDIGRPTYPSEPLTAIYKKMGIISVWQCKCCITKESVVTLVEAHDYPNNKTR